MILEEYAKYLQTADSGISAVDILARWLWEKLSFPAGTTVEHVLHCELSLARVNSAKGNLYFQLTESLGSAPVIYLFKARSASGARLLNSLYQYSLSYEQQKWARFVHSLKASDFRKIAPSQY